MLTIIVSYFNVVCNITIAFNIYFYLASFTFLLLESLIILHKLVDKVIIPVLENTVWVILLGFTPPLIYTVLTVPFIIDNVSRSGDQTQM